MRAFARRRWRPRLSRRQVEVVQLRVMVAGLRESLALETAAKRAAFEKRDALQDRLDEATATIDALLDKEPAR